MSTDLVPPLWAAVAARINATDPDACTFDDLASELTELRHNDRLAPLLILAGGGEMLAEDTLRLRDCASGKAGEAGKAGGEGVVGGNGEGSGNGNWNGKVLDAQPRLTIPNPRGSEPHDYPLFDFVTADPSSASEAWDSCVVHMLLAEQEAAAVGPR